MRTARVFEQSITSPAASKHHHGLRTVRRHYGRAQIRRRGNRLRGSRAQEYTPQSIAWPKRSRARLPAPRAAKLRASLTPDGPVALWGYSQRQGCQRRGSRTGARIRAGTRWSARIPVLLNQSADLLPRRRQRIGRRSRLSHQQGDRRLSRGRRRHPRQAHHLLAKASS